MQVVVRIRCARPTLTVLVALATAALGTGYAAHSLALETSKFHLVPLGQRYATLYKDDAQDFGSTVEVSMKRLALALMFVFSLSLLAAGFALAADDSKVKAATNQVETGYGKIAEGVGDTAKGIGKTASDGAKYSAAR